MIEMHAVYDYSPSEIEVMCFDRTVAIPIQCLALGEKNRIRNHLRSYIY
jgi:hypothetical protein